MIRRLQEDLRLYGANRVWVASHRRDRAWVEDTQSCRRNRAAAHSVIARGHSLAGAFRFPAAPMGGFARGIPPEKKNNLQQREPGSLVDDLFKALSSAASAAWTEKESAGG